MVYSLLAECGVANQVIRFFFSWKQISVIIRNIYYGQIMSYSLQAECGVANLVIRF